MRLVISALLLFLALGVRAQELEAPTTPPPDRAPLARVVVGAASGYAVGAGVGYGLGLAADRGYAGTEFDVSDYALVGAGLGGAGPLSAPTSRTAGAGRCGPACWRRRSRRGSTPSPSRGSRSTVAGSRWSWGSRWSGRWRPWRPND